MFKKDGNNETKTLSHSTYRCQYHIVFAPKYRRKEIYGNRHFWCRGYYVETVGRNKKLIEKYIQNQLAVMICL